MIACLSNVRRFVRECEKCFQGIETGAEPGEGFYLIGKKKPQIPAFPSLTGNKWEHFEQISSGLCVESTNDINVFEKLFLGKRASFVVIEDFQKMVCICPNYKGNLKSEPIQKLSQNLTHTNNTSTTLS